jgi:hypothetical protein
MRNYTHALISTLLYTMSLRYARGPSRDGRVGFTLKRTFPRIYCNMTLDDYKPYKDVRNTLPIGLFGPEPFRPVHCCCGKLMAHYYCTCVNIEKATWAKQYPDEYNAEQVALRHLDRVYDIWKKQLDTVNREITSKTFKYKFQFTMLCDSESSIGCWDCEQLNIDDCMCKCENCNQKFCFRCD